MFSNVPALPFLALGASALTTTIPANVKTFYNEIVAQGKCNNQLALGLYSYFGGPPGTSHRYQSPPRPLYIPPLC
jgi:hypothetical protein